MKMLKLLETHFESMFYNKSTSTYNNNNDLPKWQTLQRSPPFFIILPAFHGIVAATATAIAVLFGSRCVSVSELGSFQLVVLHQQSLDSHFIHIDFLV